MGLAKRLAPAAGTFEFCGERQRVSALISEMVVLRDGEKSWSVSGRRGYTEI